MKAIRQPVSTYQQFAHNLERASGPAQRVFLSMARDMDGFTALVLSCAVRGEDPEAAAAHCQCEIPELDEVIAALALSLASSGLEVAA